MRCKAKAPPAATITTEHNTTTNNEYPETMTSTELTTHHDKCLYSPSDVIIQLKVGKKQTKCLLVQLCVSFGRGFPIL